MVTPESNIEIDATLPTQARFWVPTQEDVTEEGIGWFRDVWLISDVSTDEALTITQAERELLDLVSSLAKNEDEYEKIATAVEMSSVNELSTEILERTAAAPLLELVLPDDPSPLEGLELGVSGVVMALNAAGFLTAASCRGHFSDHAWSTRPVAFFATDLIRACTLEPLVAGAGCGFGVDPSRPELIYVDARSPLNMQKLAELLVANRSAFPIEPLFQYHDEAESDDDENPNQLTLPGFE